VFRAWRMCIIISGSALVRSPQRAACRSMFQRVRLPTSAGQQSSRAAGQQPSSAFLFQQPATQPAATAGHVGHIGHIARFSPTSRLDTVYLANEGLEQRRGTACPALAHPTKPRCSTSSAAFHSVFPLPRVPHHLRSRAKSDDDPVAKQLRTTPESSAARSTSPFTLHLQLTLSLRPAGP
jgi:hypothetical protein